MARAAQGSVVLEASIPGGNRVTVEVRKGKPVPVEGALSYYARYTGTDKRHVDPVGTDLGMAWQKCKDIEVRLLARKQGLEIAGEAPAAPAAPNGRITVAAAVEAYKTDMARRKNLWEIGSIERDKLAPASQEAYTRAIEDFRDNCGVVYLDEITRAVLLAHKTWMYGNLAKRNGNSGGRTVANRFQNLKSFFHANSIEICRKRTSMPNDTRDHGLMVWAEYPRKSKKEAKKAEMYSDAEIAAMMKYASEDDGDLLQFFIQTGVRDGEAQHMTWDCIDFEDKKIWVKDQPRYSWRVKDCEKRWIPLEAGLAKRLALRRKNQKPASDLLFPLQNGEPNSHLIKRLHRVIAAAKEAGCVFKGAIEQHKFRKTFCTNVFRAGCNLATLMMYLGHSDLVTTQAYIVMNDAAGPDFVNRVAARQRAYESAVA